MMLAVHICQSYYQGAECFCNCLQFSSVTTLTDGSHITAVRNTPTKPPVIEDSAMKCSAHRTSRQDRLLQSHQNTDVYSDCWDYSALCRAHDSTKSCHSQTDQQAAHHGTLCSGTNRVDKSSNQPHRWSIIYCSFVFYYCSINSWWGFLL